MAKKDNTLLLIGGALVGAMLLMGKRSDSSDSALSETGVIGGSNDMMGGTTIPEQPQVVYNVTYTNPISIYSDVTATGNDTSSSSPTGATSTGYFSVNTGIAVPFTASTKSSIDRFGQDLDTGAVIDRYSQQSISPEEMAKRRNFVTDFELIQSKLTSSNSDNQTSSATPNFMTDFAVIGGAVGGNMALPTVAKKTNNLFGFSQDVKGKSKISQFLTDPYSVATSQAKQAGSLAVKESPKWVKGVKAVSNFIPFLDVPIGAGLDVWLTRKDDNPIGWGNALKANTAGELAQLGVTGVGAVAGVGVGGVAGWVAGTGADIATTEAVYRQLGEQSLFGTKKSTQTSNPKANTTSKTSSNAKGSSVSTGTSGLFGSKKSNKTSGSTKPKSGVATKVTNTAKSAVRSYTSNVKKVANVYKSTAKKVATKSISGVKKAVSSAKKTTSKIKSTAGKVKTKIKSFFKKKKK